MGSCTRHRTIPSTTSTMKIAIVSLVLVAAVSVNGGVLDANGMEAIDEIISTIDGMSAGATDLNAMESRLSGLKDQQDQITKAFAALSTNLNKANLGINTHTNMEQPGGVGDWAPVRG